jgi:hypothetical protein
MPSTYNQVVGYDEMGNPVTLGDNNRRTFATTKMGTRQIVNLVIYTDYNTAENYEAPNSIYSQLVRALQQQIELYGVHVPFEAFFDCYGDYAFTVDVAWDTANALWNQSPANVLTDGNPMDWIYFGNDNTNPNINDGNNQTSILLDLVYNVLLANEVDTNCWVTTNFHMGDVAWPIDIGIGGGGAPPQLAEKVGENKPGTKYAMRPGMTTEERAQQIAEWKAAVFKS